MNSRAGLHTTRAGEYSRHEAPRISNGKDRKRLSRHRALLNHATESPAAAAGSEELRCCIGRSQFVTGARNGR